MALTVLTHPLAAHLLVRLRDKNTLPDQFRRTTSILTTLLALEATRTISSTETQVTTPIKLTSGQVLGQALGAVPVLRAGLGMLDSVVQLFPDVAVGYIGLVRDETTAIASRYYRKLPDLTGRFSLCLDPMLATGGSATQAIDMIKAAGATEIVMVCVVAAPQGVDQLTRSHPDVSIVCAALDEGLDDRRFIVPGLGDFGDRLYGTE